MIIPYEQQNVVSRRKEGARKGRVKGIATVKEAFHVAYANKTLGEEQRSMVNQVMDGRRFHHDEDMTLKKAEPPPKAAKSETIKSVMKMRGLKDKREKVLARTNRLTRAMAAEELIKFI